ncbi:MAG TPA: nitroreductase family protein [Micromonosporaceae bacterium]|jgi:nitroreductase|nr:nitroreductase family protein [Micromonosporaceae bacterium]
MNTATDVLTEIVTVATRAPSMHNTQPWRFLVLPATEESIEGALIEVRSDPTRALPAGDPTGWATRVACGAAVFGIRLGITVRQHRAESHILPDPSEPDLIARVRVGPAHPSTPVERELYAAIPQRRTNRYPFNDVPPDAHTTARLTPAARQERAWLDVLKDPRRRATVAALVREAQDRMNADPAYRREVRSWVRDNNDTSDGIPRRAGGPSPATYDLLALRDYGNTERSPGRDFERDPLVCVLGSDTDHASSQVRVGMALHRVLLTATAAGLSSSMLSQPMELPDLRRRLRAALGHTSGWPQMVLRFGYGVRTPATPRRPVSDVLDIAPIRTP